ncbi:MAG: PQQ-dependent dehydrogenase, methanol/ethanol family [Bryobacteraceae bacterium]
MKIRHDNLLDRYLTVAAQKDLPSRDREGVVAWGRRSTPLTVLFFLYLVHASAQVTYQDLLKADPSQWLTYQGPYNGQRHSLLGQIHKGNVKSLTPKWIYNVPGASRLQSVPVVVDGVMYVSQPNEVHAIDGRTGRLIWQYRRQARERGPNRGVAVYGNKVYFGTPDAFLVALDARTGSLVWEAKLAEWEEGFYSPVAPLAINGKILAGIAPGDHGLNGFLDAYDAETGERLWRWNAIPKPGEPGNETWAGDSWKTGGGNTWLTGTYDPELNLIYWGIGNPAPDFDGDVRKGDNLYTESIVALDADTGKLKWYFQNTPHDLHDWDSVEVPVLVDAPFQGRKRKLLVQANRNGFYYVLDRTNGKFLHGTPFVKLLNWASGLTPEGRPIRVPGVEPTLKGNKVCPATSGATNWMSPAFNPDTGLFYVVAQEGCGISTKSADTFRPGGFPFMATGYIESPEEPWRMHVRALELTTGKLVWDYEQIGSRRYGAGLLSTAGGLIFSGDDQGFFTALDAASGKALWHFNTGMRISASPMTYSFKGQQYVAVSAGVNVVAFALHESPPPAHDKLK